MITSKELKDYLKTKINADYWYSGKLQDETKEKVIVAYPYKGVTPTIETIDETSRNNQGFTVLIHWNNHSEESELIAEEVYHQVKKINKINNKIIKQIFNTSNHAIPLGTDERGVFEFVINFFILEEVI